MQGGRPHRYDFFVPDCERFGQSGAFVCANVPKPLTSGGSTRIYFHATKGARAND